MKTKLNKKLIATIAVTAALTLPTITMAKVTGQCAVCHTMHNSQGGLPMADNSSEGGVDTDPNIALLVQPCLGCHTGTPAATGTPFVNTVAEPTGGTLAGGNFYWAVLDNTKGHNVVGIGTDPKSAAPPGGTLTGPLTCAGATGCHTVGGSHHTTSDNVMADPLNATLNGREYADGSTLSNSYRMLDGIMGIEDPDWEFTTTVAEDHNYYSGSVRTVDTENVTSTISSLCAQCHGDFHNGANNISEASDMSTPWVRHPTDFDMSALATTSEYNGYASYSVVAPVASDNLLKTFAPLDADTDGGTGASTGNAIVMCISCHRAHGSAYEDLLRWEYSTILAGTSNANGCFICHTTKDDA